MRLAWLFLRSRLTGPALAGIALTGVLAIFWENWFGHEAEAMTAAFVLFPLVVACIVGNGAHSPFGETELTVSLPLARLRDAQLTGLVVLGALALLLAAATWPLPDDGGTLARNLAGLAGLALLSTPIAGGRLAWITPLTVVMAAQFRDLSEGVASWLVFTWPRAAFGNDRALVIALALLAGGLVVVHLFGPKLIRDETVV